MCLGHQCIGFTAGAVVERAARLMQEYSVSKGTAVKALDVLRREGLTRTVAGWGTFVAERG